MPAAFRPLLAARGCFIRVHRAALEVRRGPRPLPGAMSITCLHPGADDQDHHCKPQENLPPSVARVRKPDLHVSTAVLNLSKSFVRPCVQLLHQPTGLHNLDQVGVLEAFLSFSSCDIHHVAARCLVEAQYCCFQAVQLWSAAEALNAYTHAGHQGPLLGRGVGTLRCLPLAFQGFTLTPHGFSLLFQLQALPLLPQRLALALQLGSLLLQVLRLRLVRRRFSLSWSESLCSLSAVQLHLVTPAEAKAVLIEGDCA
mmetsp:Transcript_42058/g.78135  ORF Transcript_42058/g.78135 Transcript_42058/m.78135 type:complete len:256 (+) Transcript_42058:571-1338(+)